MRKIMFLIPLREMLAKALTGGYAVGYFETWDQYSLEAVLEAAEESRSPVILGFGGESINQKWCDSGGLRRLAALGRAAAEDAKVPVTLLLNEVKTLEQIRRGLTWGFNAVMLDTSNLSLEQNIAATRKVVEIAHALGADVEGELWRLPQAKGTTDLPSVTENREPAQAARYVKETGLDALSISIGNVHCLTEGKAKIDFNLLVRLKQMVKVPFVVHGGTGFPDDAVPRVIEMGVAKFNVGTILKQIFWSTIRETVGTLPSTINVQEVIGSRKAGDFLEKAKNKMKSEVKRRMRVYGSTGKA
ncbi:MAG: class II fructose-bisphosphate aldolase [Candidatus Omnitrophota bacterium]